jgi:hypothetical protein
VPGTGASSSLTLRRYPGRTHTSRVPLRARVPVLETVNVGFEGNGRHPLQSKITAAFRVFCVLVRAHLSVGPNQGATLYRGPCTPLPGKVSYEPSRVVEPSPVPIQDEVFAACSYGLMPSV